MASPDTLDLQNMYCPVVPPPNTESFFKIGHQFFGAREVKRGLSSINLQHSIDQPAGRVANE